MKRFTLQKVCSRGHKFKKSSDCPVCPVCWSGYYKKKETEKIPVNIPAPALRALLSARITTLNHLTKYSEKELLALHGFGPSSLPKLKLALKKHGLSLKK